MRYSPGSLVIVVSPSEAECERFLDRAFADEKGAVLSPRRIRTLIAGRVPDEMLDEKGAELRVAAALKRLEAGESTVVATEGLTAEERKVLLRTATGLRRPRHMILLDVGRDDLDEEQRDALNALRTALDIGELGKEGFQTAMRLGGAAVGELKRIVFRSPPKDD
ncbi:unannotated protein [freshwater metagenome]|uniref:Unannotated protein n=1 Tax=freshwater metagenome TaxID=449393 RepID=A0A6J7DZA2_9ZZZZ